jgi:hypothetical protein
VSLLLDVKDNGRFISTSVTVKDRNIGALMPMVFSPDSTSEKYRMYLHPGGNYEAEIYANGSLLTRIRLDIPDDTYELDVTVRVNLRDLVFGGKLIARDLQILGTDMVQHSMDSVQLLGENNPAPYFSPIMDIVEQMVKSRANFTKELDDFRSDPFRYEPPGEPLVTDPYFTALILGIDSAIRSTDPWIVWDLATTISGRDSAYVKMTAPANVPGALAELHLPVKNGIVGELLQPDMDNLSVLLQKANPFYVQLEYIGSGTDQEGQKALLAIQNFLTESGVSLDRIESSPILRTFTTDGQVNIRLFHRIH